MKKAGRHMTGIVALTILFCVYAVSELIAQKTKAVFSTVLGISLLFLAGFWSGVLPRTLIEDAQISGFGNLIAGVLIVSLGTTIDFPELKRQWKVVVISLCCVICAVGAIILAGSPLMGSELAVSGAPIFAGGSAATLIMTTALKEKGLEYAGTFCIALYVTQIHRCSHRLSAPSPHSPAVPGYPGACGRIQPAGVAA